MILGAGAAGLSLCVRLLAHGVRDPILLLDRKEGFADDRTWCFWDVRPTPFTRLAARCWHGWDVVGADGRGVSQESPGVGYVCLRGRDFYGHALAEIARHPNVTLALGCPAAECESFPGHARVRAGGRWHLADYVFDSRPPRVPDGPGPAFMQRFFGQSVRTDAPAFDPARCTLMDFRASQADGLHFFYVLPFSPTEALVENTYVLDSRAAPAGPERHRAEIGAYLARPRGLTRYSVVREEAGAIPMTARPFPVRDGRVFFLGTAGGCARPSSGYAFLRIQDQCAQIAAAAASGALGRFRPRAAPARSRFFDAVFLEALCRDPAAFPGYFHRLFSRVPPEALTAFLSETSLWRSDLRILRSLPLGPFLRAALAAAARRKGAGPPPACGPG